MSSGYIPSKGEPGPEEILDALREAIFGDPRLTEMPAEEVARQLVLGGHLQEEPSPVLVADMLDALDAEEGGFEANELSEEGNPTSARDREELRERSGSARPVNSYDDRCSSASDSFLGQGEVQELVPLRGYPPGHRLFFRADLARQLGGLLVTRAIG